MSSIIWGIEQTEFSEGRKYRCEKNEVRKKGSKIAKPAKHRFVRDINAQYSVIN